MIKYNEEMVRLVVLAYVCIFVNFWFMWVSKSWVLA